MPLPVSVEKKRRALTQSYLSRPNRVGVSTSIDARVDRLLWLQRP
jgi:hypothetical protein